MEAGACSFVSFFSKKFEICPAASNDHFNGGDLQQLHRYKHQLELQKLKPG
jgi:hypothetical protein